MTTDRKPDIAPDVPPVDPALAAAWQEHSREEPPAALDTAILAAAHRAAGAHPRDVDVLAEAREPERWWWPLAAAAAIGAVAFGVIQLLPSEHDAANTVVSDTPSVVSSVPKTPASVAPAISPAPPQAPGAAAAPDAAPVQKQDGERPELQDRKSAESATPAVPVAPASREVPALAKRAPPSPTSAPAPPRPAAAPAPLAEHSEPRAFPAESRAADATAPFSHEARGNIESAIPPVTEPSGQVRGRADAARSPAPPDSATLLGKTTTALVAPQPTPRAESAAGVAPRNSQASAPTQPNGPLTTEEWIARLRALRRDGREAEAQAALQAFRIAWPDADARLPPDLREWAATVKRAPGR